jgi:GrpB-like predicted nucleotidyltransferase (UPF0157 family)
MEEKQSAAKRRLAPGLCEDCVHARRIESDRNSFFLLCNLSFTDARFPKYPRLPVLTCSGHRSEIGGSANPVVVVDYDPQWPATFEILSAPLAGALGTLAAAIEHVGSTSVPGLAAKPIIDIDVLLKSTTDLPLVIQRLACIGYVHRGDLGVAGREAFYAPPGSPKHHLYVCPPESREYRRHLALRDFLRTHSAEAENYGKLKRSLGARFRNDRSAYNEGKSEFVEALLQRALLAP